MATARGQKRGSGGQGSRRRAGRSGGPLRQDRAWAPLRGAQLGGSEHPRDLGQASPLAGLLRYPSRMGRLVRLFEGRFGRLLLMELAPGKMLEALADPVIVLHQKDGELLFLNPGEVHVYQEPTRALVFHAAGGWLHAGFPAVFGPEDPRPFALLVVEAAICRLSSGDGKISEVSAELGFSAQSNFTRFFLNQVGVPPSEYRRSARGSDAPTAEDPET